MLKIAHIINPVAVKETSDLFAAQPVTFETMRRAKDFCRDSVEVELIAACYSEDDHIVPDYFIRTRPLERSIMDVAGFQKPRKLPLITDILDRLHEVSEADYFIYTNVDIALQPHFYASVKSMIEEGCDAFAINRRTIPGQLNSIDQLPLMYAHLGEKHPGYDCFVFKREAYQGFDLGRACIGANWIGRVLISNLIARSDRFKVFEDEHLTFHIGDDRSWKITEYNDYDRHNEAILAELLERLVKSHADKPYLRDFLKFHRQVQGSGQPQPQRFTAADIVRYNTVELQLPESPEKIYGSKYKPSSAWQEPVLLRQDPIFVVGYPRSGTTLLQSLIATQPGVFSLPEIHFFFIIRPKLEVENDRIKASCLDNVIHCTREKVRLSVNAEQQIRYLAGIGELSPKMLYEIIIVDNAVDKIGLNMISSQKWLEKTPDNVLFLDVIFRFYPQAKIVNIVRNPEKAILSRRRYFAGEEDWPIHRHAEKWVKSIRSAESCHSLYPGKLLTIKLEDLVKDMAGTMEKVSNFLGIPLDAGLLQNHKKIAQEFVMPWETWKQDTARDVSSTISDKAHLALSPEDKRQLLKTANSEMSRYGYLTRNILVFAEVPSHPQQHGNSRRIHNYCRYLKGTGCRIHYVYFRVHPGLAADTKAMEQEWDSLTIIEKNTVFKKSGEGFAIDDTYQKGLGEEISALCAKYDVDTVICNYVFQSKLLEYLPSTILKIIDTHDKFTNRHLLLQANGVPEQYWWYYYTGREEARGLDRADVVLAIQPNEAYFFHTMSKSDVFVLPHVEFRQYLTRSYETLSRIGFIGSDNAVNVKNVNDFIAAYDRFARQHNLKAKICLAGLVCNKIEVESEFVEKMGLVENVADFYQGVDLIINPLLFGTGLKIKTVEALSFGVPVLSTTIGFEGITSECPDHQCRSLEELNERLLQVQRNPGEKLSRLAQESRRVFSLYQEALENIMSKIFSKQHQVVDQKEKSTDAFLSEAVGRLCRINFWKNPLEKMKAYKHLVSRYFMI